VIFLYTSNEVASAFKSTIELELSTAIAKGVFTISKVLRDRIGFISNNKTPNTVKKRKKAKIKCDFDLILAL
jgi:hypothetical protein